MPCGREDDVVAIVEVRAYLDSMMVSYPTPPQRES
jgi:hypothetical protein